MTTDTFTLGVELTRNLAIRSEERRGLEIAKDLLAAGRTGDVMTSLVALDHRLNRLAGTPRSDQ